MSAPQNTIRVQSPVAWPSQRRPSWSWINRTSIKTTTYRLPHSQSSAKPTIFISIIIFHTTLSHIISIIRRTCTHAPRHNTAIIIITAQRVAAVASSATEVAPEAVSPMHITLIKPSVRRPSARHCIKSSITMRSLIIWAILKLLIAKNRVISTTWIMKFKKNNKKILKKKSSTTIFIN